MNPVVTGQQMRRYEQACFDSGRETGLSLMEKAASGVTAYLLKHPMPGPVLILIGGGNNGGDGWAVLRQLQAAGTAAHGIPAMDEEKLTGDARINYIRAVEAGCSIRKVVTPALLSQSGWVVDALFGTGLNRPISGRYKTLIEQVNAAHKRVLSVDLPSGVDGDTGRILGAAIQADVTVTFQYLKRGHLLFPGRGLCGDTVVHGLTECAVAEADEALFHMGGADAARLLPSRPMDSHKGDNGRALLCVGSMQYTGAALMSAAAALRAGCGVLEACVPALIKPAFNRLPEVCCTGVGKGDGWDRDALEDAARRLHGKRAAGMGPGMGKMENDSLLCHALGLNIPLVLDADALNFMTEHPHLLSMLHKNVLLTPHPGEMARLTGRSAEEIAEDPVGTAQSSTKAWNCCVLLKGATTCISDGTRTVLNTTGNPGLAKGGSGDVLTGIVTGLMAQGLSAFDSGCCGAYLLGVSAEEALRLLSTRALTAGDVIDAITGCIFK